MGTWIYCNKCFSPMDRSIKMYINECGHILCEKCVTLNKSKEKCQICMKDSDLVELNENLNEETCTYFRNNIDQFSEALEVYKFQNRQMLMNLNGLYKKYKFVKNAYQKEFMTRQKMENEIKAFRNLKITGSGGSSSRGGDSGKRPFITSTPMSASNKGNLSSLSASSFIQPKLPGRVQRTSRDSVYSTKRVPTFKDNDIPQIHRSNENLKSLFNKIHNFEYIARS